jgi:iron(II)-dependent oxidoreductase
MQQDIDKPPTAEPFEWKQGIVNEEIEINGGSFAMGSDWRHAYDNEKPPQDVQVDAFKVDLYPVTAYQWAAFMADGGYKNDSLWSAEGRDWRDKEGATMPEYWKLIDGARFWYAPTEVSPVHPDQPVQGVSWHEAQAYCKWAGRRLLNEAEAEFLRHNHQPGDIALTHGPFPVPAPLKPGVENHTGNVWEWSDSRFRPYPGFQPFPYEGYSAAHMEGEHYVCRGGSWATTQVIRRPSFRNWYVPGYRQGFLGLRTASP